MRYSLWSHDRLVGYTDLDIHTITATMRQGFIDPTPEGKPLLEDATGVWRAITAHHRARRSGDDAEQARHEALVIAAMGRREALDFELRDANGRVFECDFMRVYDLTDSREFDADAEARQVEEEADFEIHLSTLAPEQRAAELAERAAFEAEIEETVASLRDDWAERALYGSGWPPEDPRWDVMQYHLQVHLKSCFGGDDFSEFDEPDE